MDDENALHTPVLLEEVVRFVLDPSGLPVAPRLLDATCGSGGHSEALLERHQEAVLLAGDRDMAAIAVARRRLARFGARVRLVQVRFSELDQAVAGCGWERVDGVVMDLGLSSMMLAPQRGFSYSVDCELDMRMDQGEQQTAAAVLNTLPAEELARIFFEYGEIRQSRRLAQAIVERRRQEPWRRSGELAALVRQVVRRPPGRHGPVEAPCFQALRMYVNHELEELQTGLAKVMGLLAPGGRLAVISYHRGEDRIVKNVFRQAAAEWVQQPELATGWRRQEASVEVVTRKPLRPTPAEVQRNPRAAAARLRLARRLSAAAN